MEKELINLEDFKRDVQTLFEEDVDERVLLNFVYDMQNTNLEDFPFEYVTEKEKKAEDASGYWTDFILKRKSDNKFFKLSAYDCKEFDCDYLEEVKMKIKMKYKWE
jgi:hypothetical protein